MYLPVRENQWLIQLSVGTGVAPMRSFIEQRILEGAKGNFRKSMILKIAY